MCKEGATLIELMVALGICITLIAASMSFTTHLRRFACRAELALLDATIRTEQQKARITGNERVIQFAQNNKGYTTATSTHQLQPGVEFGYPPGAYGPPSKETAPITKPITFKHNKIVCHRTGIVQAGTLYMANYACTQFYALTASVSRHTFLRTYYYNKRWLAL